MSIAANLAGKPLVIENLLQTAREAVSAAQTIQARCEQAMFEALEINGQVPSSAVDEDQFAAHGLSWLATYVSGLNEMHHWAERLQKNQKLGETESLILQYAFAEYLSQIAGGIPMSQNEIVRLSDLGADDEAIRNFHTSAVTTLISQGKTKDVVARLAQLLSDAEGTATFGNVALDEEFDLIRDQFRRFADEKVVEPAHQWHLKNDYIPMQIVQEMSELGVFGLTIPEQYGGHGFGKTAMCVVSEELSRGYIGVGSLGTRSEIAAELILGGGTTEQKDKWLPKIAAGEILPTAVFTEPNTGSDLGSLRTRASKDGNVYKVMGNKTWITHAARADVMTLLVRTNPDAPGYKGLSMFLAEKPRGDDANPFPANGMSGGEIEVLGYRGMKEFELAFDGFEVKSENLLGQEEGQGFKQLMQTFESARIQTAARAVGVAQSALEIGLRYAKDRLQFGKAIFGFPRVHGKLVNMAVEIMIARQLTYHAAREKDEGRRCDLEAGMAKLLGARVAWAAADNAVQIHGGNGFALEYPVSRVLQDARILNIFEGAAEIQAQVIVRRLLERGRN